jgi:hypothetical protein
MAREVVTLFAQQEGQTLIRKHCRQVGLEVEDLRRLIEEVIEKDSMQRRHGLWQAFDEVLEGSGTKDG